MSKPEIDLQWVSKLDEATADGIVSLVDWTAGDGGTLGYAEPMASDEAERFISDLQYRIFTGQSHLLLGRSQSEPIAMAVLSVNGMPNCRHRAEISKGVVHPSFRGRRLVQRVFRELLDRSRMLGVEQLVLDVREGSRAHDLWQHFGFLTYGVLDDYARIDGVRYRGHLMVQTVEALSNRLVRSP